METPKKKGRFIVRFFPDKNKVTDKLPTDAPQTQVSISAVEGSSHIAVGHKRMPESSKSLYLYDEDMQSMPRTVTFLDSFKFHLDSMGTYPSEKAEKRAATISHKAKLGTLLGVYLPTIQHIMGLLMFIRHSWIVGHCGLIECLLMVSLCCLTWQLLKHTDSSSRIFEHKQLKSKDKLTKAAAAESPAASGRVPEHAEETYGDGLVMRDFSSDKEESMKSQPVHFTFSAKDAKKMIKESMLEASQILRMHNAMELNKVLNQKSIEAELIIMNLPPPPSKFGGDENYMQYVTALTNNLRRVLFVRGSGKEVVSLYS